MSVIALIPARSGSKRVPNKNIKDFFGHPLLAYTIQVAKDCGLFDKNLYVSSDSEEYLNLAHKYGALPIKRPPRLSQGDISTDAWVNHALKTFSEDQKFKAIVLLYITMPFRSGDMLRKVFNIAQNRNCDVRTVEKCKQHPFKMWKYELTNIGKEIRPAFHNEKYYELPYHELPDFFIQRPSVVVSLPESEGILPYELQGYEGFDINTPEDWILAEELVKRGLVELPEITK